MRMVDFEWDIINRRKKILESEMSTKKTELEKLEKNISETQLSTRQNKEQSLKDLISQKDIKLREIEDIRASHELIKIEVEAMETKKNHTAELTRVTNENIDDNPKIKKLMQNQEQYMGLEQIDIELYPLIDSDHVKKYYDEGLLQGKLNVVKRKHYYAFKHKNLIAIIKYHLFGIKPKKQLMTDDCKTEKLTLEIPQKYVDNINNIAKDLHLTPEDIFCEALVLYKEKIQYSLITEKERLLDKVKKIEERMGKLYETMDSK